jgi:SAM-dependent methyltransferase
MRHGSPQLHERIREALAPDGIWQLPEQVRALLAESLARLPKGDVAEGERRYPTTRTGLRVSMDAFFARHYFQVQDSLLDFFASPALPAVARRGTMHVADIGCGPAVAALAILDAASVTMELLENGGAGPRPLTVHLTLNDTSEVCLSEARRLLDSYSRSRSKHVLVGRVLPLSTAFPKSIVQLQRVARMVAPFDICCLGYVLDPITEQVGIEAAVRGIRQLVQTGNPTGGRLLLTQDKFREGLHRDICEGLGVPAEMADLKQRVYDSQNQNEEQTYTYCRSCSPVSELATAMSGVAVV